MARCEEREREKREKRTVEALRSRAKVPTFSAAMRREPHFDGPWHKRHAAERVLKPGARDRKRATDDADDDRQSLLFWRSECRLRKLIPHRPALFATPILRCIPSISPPAGWGRLVALDPCGLFVEKRRNEARRRRSMMTRGEKRGSSLSSVGRFFISLFSAADVLCSLASAPFRAERERERERAARARFDMAG